MKKVDAITCFLIPKLEIYLYIITHKPFLWRCRDYIYIYYTYMYIYSIIATYIIHIYIAIAIYIIAQTTCFDADSSSYPKQSFYGGGLLKTRQKVVFFFHKNKFLWKLLRQKAKTGPDFGTPCLVPGKSGVTAAQVA